MESLRLIPDVNVWRPADPIETALVWAYAAARPDGERPNVLILTRQKTAAVKRREGFALRDVWRGGYIVVDAEGGSPDVTIVATGSELGLALEAREKLSAEKVKVRVVSMPCRERFEAQPKDYQNSVVPAGDARSVAVVEAGRDFDRVGYKLVGRQGLVIGIDHFGASAPGELLAEKFGFTGPAVTDKIREWIGRGKTSPPAAPGWGDERPSPSHRRRFP